MSKYICTVCGYVYDEAKGIPEAGVAPGTGWEQLPEGWVCPTCGASKSEFKKENGQAAMAATPVTELAGDEKELTALELSVICSNLARGCEKQYKAEAAEQFARLARYFQAAAPPAVGADMDALLALVEKDIEQGLPAANAVSAAAGDRGALRALVWSEKVTRILRSLLARYEKEGEAMLENTGVCVCTICGFIQVGDAPPQLCPVCKVPGWKFEKIEGRAMA